MKYKYVEAPELNDRSLDLLKVWQAAWQGKGFHDALNFPVKLPLPGTCNPLPVGF